MKKILCVIGTRPEAIKMAPLVLALRASPWARVRVLATAQHRDMLDEAMALFGIAADVDLDIMQSGQTLTALTARLLTGLHDAIAAEAPDVVLAQGDTTTVLTTALASFYLRIPFGHVEAGLRTGDLDYPFPEEMNRCVAGHLARVHFAPTQRARECLLREGIPDRRIVVTGNTVIDALQLVAARDVPLRLDLPAGKRIVLLTAHRRENFGAPLREVLHAVRDLVDKHRDLHVVYPVHPNPNVAIPAHEILSSVPGVTLTEPLDYGRLVTLLKLSWLVLTDSGGLQEEAPALHKPVLVLRDETERPEAVEAGVVQLVGPRRAPLIAAVDRLIADPAVYRRMAQGASPYGDGHAAARIVRHLEAEFTDRGTAIAAAPPAPPSATP
jgi:UDP-N-acetylglucosamine 2-epimerase (non-hydrolysing)